ncbi:L-lactate dehydrogenase [Staphylococcus caprae]|uniref:L-lactate dehydrogenase n=1 Tax=Staphylococcus caprae TaxID=29380 RepID=UPI001BCEE512|nr:L-lactate dehydrogenase [Staphylococcus caprae]
MKKFSKKVVLIGDGSVGSSYAFAMVTQGIADEFVIIDIAKDKVEADVKDLNHGALYSASPVTVKAGEYSDCKDADLVVITAGAPQKPGETRLQLVEKNTKIMKSIVSSVMDSGFDGFFLIAANPVDILTRYVKEVTGLPAERVIGSGTVLDSARFRYLISQELNVVPSSVHASIIGEHGDSELAVWSQANVAGISVFDTLKEQTGSEAKAEELYVNTRDAAYDIIQAKGSTYYGIALALLRISKALLNNENSVLTVSSQLNGEYEHKGVYLGVPTLINQNGAIKVYETPLSDDEKQLFDQSVSTLEETYESIKHLV